MKFNIDFNIDISILFRVLLFVPMVLLLMYALLPAVEHLWLSCDELSLLEANGFKAILPVKALGFSIYMVVWLLISAGLFFYIRIARHVYAIFIFISVVLLALIGRRVSAPVENIIMFLMTLSIGAIVTLMYSVSTQSLFAKEDEPEEVGDEDEDDFPGQG